VQGYVGIGSDLGDRRHALRTALEGIARRGLAVWACSSVWEAEPVDVPGSRGFLNMVAEIRVDDRLGPSEVLNRLLDVEREAGRTRGGRHRSRVVDIDLLILGELRCSGPILTLPHPRMWSRRFVLAPLSEIAPHLRSPSSGRTVLGSLALLPERPSATKIGALDPFVAAPVYSGRL